MAAQDDDLQLDSDDDTGQPQRRHVAVGQHAPKPTTTASRSVWDLARPPEQVQAAAASKPGRPKGGKVQRLPQLDIAALKPKVMNKPPMARPERPKGTRYDALFVDLKPGEMYEIDIAYQATVRRVMCKVNKAGPKQFSIRTLPNEKFGIWRDR